MTAAKAVRLDPESVAAIAVALAEPMPGDDALLDAIGAGRLLNVPGSWLLAEARRDRIPHVRSGRYVRFSRGDLLTWVAARTGGPRQERR